MPHKSPRSSRRDTGSLKYTMDSMMTRSDSFSLGQRKPDDIKEMLSIVKTQAQPIREGTDFDLKKRAPLPDIGKTASLNIVMETGPNTPRIYVDKSSDFERSDSTLSNNYMSRSTSHLSASLDETSFRTPRQEFNKNFASPQGRILTKNLVSRSMETFPRHTPRKTHRLRPMGQRRLSSVPESRLSALAGSRSKLQISDENPDMPLPKFPSERQHKHKRHWDKRQSNGAGRPTAPMPDVSSQSVLFEESEPDFYLNTETNESPRSDLEISELYLPINTRRMHRKQQHDRRIAEVQNRQYEHMRPNTPIEIRDDLSEDDLIDYVIED